MFQRIVVALRPGADSLPLPELTQFVAAPGAQIRLVSLVRLGTNDDERQRLDQTSNALTTQADALKAAEYDATAKTEFMKLMTGHRITEIGRQHVADLTVICLSKRSRVGKALLDSVAQSVLMPAEGPVLSSRLHSGAGRTAGRCRTLRAAKRFTRSAA